MKPTGDQVVATNRQARRNYELGDTFECGIVLRGSEVKSLRESAVQIAEAYAVIEGGEVWLHGLHIAPYSHAQSHTGHEAVRPRKLLLHRREIDRIRHRMQTERLALVPLRLYFKEGRAKVEIAVGKGKRTVDKRQDIARRDADREAARAVARGRRGES
ncbi:MAG: SsrA-binding protein SmpB [Acidobacteria bacterium]|nr:SsrA-binding protein SmpB [Acidobacteriota bacterium]